MQIIRRLGIVALCLVVLVITGCGKKADQDESAQPTETAGTQNPEADAPADYAKMAEENRKALIEANKGKVIEAVPAATLKALLPAELAGMTLSDASAERTQMMGMDMSNADGQYSATDGSGANVRIKLTDTGNMSGQMKMGLASWAMMQYSRETDTGYEKTTTINGCKGMEKYDTQNKEGSIQILVADRFIVEVQGYNTTMEAIKKAVDQIDLKKLAASGS